jgi:hypothetical protein
VHLDLRVAGRWEKLPNVELHDLNQLQFGRQNDGAGQE